MRRDLHLWRRVPSVLEQCPQACRHDSAQDAEKRRNDHESSATMPGRSLISLNNLPDFATGWNRKGKRLLSQCVMQRGKSCKWRVLPSLYDTCTGCEQIIQAPMLLDDQAELNHVNPGTSVAMTTAHSTCVNLKSRVEPHYRAADVHPINRMYTDPQNIRKVA